MNSRANKNTYKQAIWLSAVISISGLFGALNANAKSSIFSNKTFILQFEHEGTRAEAKYYISKSGKVFFIFQTKCGSVGSTAMIGYSGSAYINCDGLSVNNSLAVSVSGSVFQAEETQNASQEGGTYQTIRSVSFFYDGLVCTPIAYKFYLHNEGYASQGISFESTPVSCDVSDGRR